jgi:cell division protein FtsB
MRKKAGSKAGSDVTIIFQALSSMKAPVFRFAFAIAFFAVIAYAFVTLSGPNGIPGLARKQREIQEMERSNAALAKEIERKTEHIKRLETNPAEQELEIRNRLKLVKPGEKVYITGDPSGK